jgi:peptidoglycan-associated lipoprotein
MRNKWWMVLALLFVVPGLLFTVGCAKKAVQTDAAVSQATDQDQAALEAERARKAAEAARLAAEAEAKRLAEEARQRELAKARDEFLNENVHFEFDRADLTPEAVAVLKKKASWLGYNPQVAVMIQGHCDERGTNEYNLALGERRAQSAKNFLVTMGIDGARLSMISYGEERPLDPGHTEEAWAKNRRAQFVIQ